VAVKIRLKRLGKIRAPHYRIVVIDARAKRDGRAIEEIGIYHPKNDPSVIEVNSDRAQYWLGVGAQPTEAVVAIFKKSGDWQKFTGATAAVESAVEGQKPRPDKVARFNQALAEADNEPATAAISRSKRQQAAAEAAEAAEADEQVAAPDDEA